MNQTRYLFSLALVTALVSACTGEIGGDAEQSTLEGRLVVTVVMPEDEALPPRHEWFVDTETDRWVRLEMEDTHDHPPYLEGGVRVRALGRRTGDAAFRAVSLEALDHDHGSHDHGHASSALVAPTPKKVAVILATFSDLTTQPITVEQARTTTFTGATSTNAYFKEVSFGARSLVGKARADGDVFGWYAISLSSTSCDYVAWGNAARTAAQNAGVNLTGYDHIVHYFPRTSCGWGGVGQVPGRYTWINGAGASTIAHELGHNFGLHHSSSLTCRDGSGTRVPISSSCTTGEYGDPFDVMGSGYRHLNAYQKGRAGFLEATSTATATADGTFTVVPIEKPSAGVQSLRVAIPGTTLYYYVELRQNFGFDTFSSTSNVTKGVLIHRAPAYGTLDRPKLIDTNPATSTFGDAALQVGATFTDAAAKISIKLLSIDAAGAKVQVDLP
jgi:hypothetical protein